MKQGFIWGPGVPPGRGEVSLPGPPGFWPLLHILSLQPGPVAGSQGAVKPLCARVTGLVPIFLEFYHAPSFPSLLPAIASLPRTQPHSNWPPAQTVASLPPGGLGYTDDYAGASRTFLNSPPLSPLDRLLQQTKGLDSCASSFRQSKGWV